MAMTLPAPSSTERSKREPEQGPLIALTDVIRVFREADVETIALRGVDLAIVAGEFVAIIGRSGSGKSTLLGLLAGLDRPTAGRVIVDGIDVARAEEANRAGLRGRRVGIVFQSGNLIPFLDLQENIELAGTLAGRRLDTAAGRSILERVGLGQRGRHRPTELSGGEQQRAALAMVLATGATIILADEITGELDSRHAAEVLDLLGEIRRERGATLVVATHDRAVAERADRVVELRDGQIVSDRRTA